MTGLYNRRKLFEDFPETQDMNICNVFYGVAIIDVDFFKLYNDTYGHLKGDACLRKIGDIFLEIKEKYNVNFYRYGGEEFVMVALNNKGKSLDEICHIVIKEISRLDIENLRAPLKQLTVSIGYEVIDVDKENRGVFRSTLSHADEALYWVKNNGRNQVKRY